MEKEINRKKEVVKLKLNKEFFLFAGISLLLILIMCGSWFLYPQIKLIGKSNLTLNYKEKYVEKGYIANFMNHDITDKVKVSGSVNTKKLGTYKITYSVSGILKKNITRTVEVKDISKPTISVSDSKEVYLCPGEKFKKEDISAFDNYDGDITKKIEVIENEDEVIYRVKDSSGNVNEVKKKLIYQDNTKPEVILNGSKYVYAFLNEDYSDKGYSAKDNCDGDITSKVKINGNVDTSKTGKYEIKYSVTDDNGNNSDEIVRTVLVSERGRAGTIYLTFDDGPQDGTTNVILDILKEEGIEATFFVTNKGSDELIKRAYDEGHTIALHTATHDYATVYSSVDNYFNDLNSVNERVKRITGEYSYIIRFPGGSSNTISRRYSPGIMSTLVNEVVNRGYKYYDWNISSGDAAGGRPTAEQIKNNVINSLRKDKVNMVLMHDIKTWTRDSLKEIIQYGKNNGYVFEKITLDTEMVRQRVNN